MVVTIMPSTISILKQLKSSYPQFTFERGDKFQWSYAEKTIYYDSLANNQAILLLHELSHALLGHSSYNRDIQLISMERQAWDHTTKLAPLYGVLIDDEIVQLNLDSYRNWLHTRSSCPKCSANGLQTDEYIYKCPACNHMWRVNEAKTCALRRYKTTRHS